MKNVIGVILLIVFGYTAFFQAAAGDRFMNWGPGILVCAFIAWRLIVINKRAAIRRENEQLFNEYMRNQLRNNRR